MRLDCSRIVFSLLVVLGFLGAMGATAAEHEIKQELWIEGQAYMAHLAPSSVNAVAHSGEDVHYKGHFPDDPDGWIRVSRLEDGWEGLAFVFGRLHIIRSGGSKDQVMSFSYSPEEAPQCGMDHLHADTSITMDSMAQSAMVGGVSATYETLCQDSVDGACLMLELELAFDLEFQRRFPSDYQSRAGAIINMVEGFYEAQFGIIFDTLSLTYMSNELFSNTTNASQLLDDIRTKRNNDQIPFLKSRQSIFHFVSGRSYQDGIAGVAYLGSVCVGQGYATGISRFIQSNSLTAIVVAHEIGHNLGSEHDSLQNNTCPSDINIMSPSVSDNYDSFSSCSYDYISEEISSLSAVEQCFNFPADAGLEALVSNASEVAEGDVYQGYFDIVYQDASQSADRLAVEGSIGEGEGRLLSVALNGAACNLFSGRVFQCDETSTLDGLRLTVEVEAGGSPTLNLVQGVALRSDSGDVKDIIPGNDTLLTQVSVTPGDGTSRDLPPDQDAPDTRSDNSSTSTTTSSGGGGGGALGWFWLLIGLAGFGVRLSSRAAG